MPRTIDLGLPKPEVVFAALERCSFPISRASQNTPTQADALVRIVNTVRR